MNTTLYKPSLAIKRAVLPAVLLLSLTSAGSILAADIEVTATNDVIDANAGSCAGMTIANLPGGDGQVTLREAICAANGTVGADTIRFANLAGSPDTYTLSLSGSELPDAVSPAINDLDITENVTIIGNGASETIINANSIGRVMHVNSTTATIQHLTLTGGLVPAGINDNGGGLYATNSNVTLEYLIVENNNSPIDDGGGIYNNFGTLTVRNSIIRNNNSGDHGGGITSFNTNNVLVVEDSYITGNTSGDNGGGIYSNSSTGTATIRRSTISGNQAQDRAGGIEINTAGTIENTTISGNTVTDEDGGGLYAQSTSTTATLNFVTITNNTAPLGGGIQVNSGNLNFKNTVVAGNTGTASPNDDCNLLGTLTSQGNNLTGTGTGCPSSGTGDITTTTANLGLGALLNNSVSTAFNRPTHMPSAISPAINAASNTGAPATDGRGAPRIASTTADIGAVERHATEPPFDFGDAPDSYGTSIDKLGASHFVNSLVFMGAAVDREINGAPTAGATGDSDDGISGLPTFASGSSVNVTVHGGPNGGMLDGWVDYDRNGVFDHPAEHINSGTSVSVSAGAGNNVAITVPAMVNGGASFARFRISTAGSLMPTGESIDGEVEDVAVTVTANAPPVANAGPDQTGIAAGATVTLAGSVTDPDSGDTHTYAWTQPSGTPVTLSSTTASGPTFTAPNPGIEQSETLTFSLIVNDGTVDSAADTVDITVDGPANTIPTANAGPDQPTVASGSVVTLDGSASSSEDAGQAIASYTWTETTSTGVVLANPTTATPMFTAPTLVPGAADVIISFNLVVNDGFANSATDSVTITVKAPANTAPTANAGPDQPNVASGSTVTLDGSASSSEDAGQAIASYTWTETTSTGVVLTNGTTAAPSFTAPSLVPGAADVIITFSLVVNDGIDNSTADTVTITVKAPPNTIPIANAGPDQPMVASGATVTLDGSASTPEDMGQSIVSYTWTETTSTGVVLTNGTTASPTFTAPTLVPAAPDTIITFSLVVNDGIDNSVADTVTITVKAPANTVPTANAGPDQPNVASQATVTLDGSASSSEDAGQAIASYTWTETTSTGVVLSNGTTASPTFTAPTLVPNAPDTIITFSLVVNDGIDNSVADTVTITVKAPANIAPTANAGPDQPNVASGATVTLDGSASSSENAGQALVSYTWTETTSIGVVLTNGTTVAPTFTAPTLVPGAADVIITFSLVVNDGIDNSTADTVTITVKAPPNTIPIANAGPDQPMVASGATVTLDGSASTSEDSGQSIVSYTWTETTSTGVVLTNGTTSSPTFTAPTLVPAAPDTIITFSLIVNDGIDNSVADTVTITVKAPANTVPTANAGPDQPNAASGATITLDGSASSSEDAGQAIASYTWTETTSTGVVLTNGTTASPSFTAPSLVPAAPDTIITFSLVVNDGIDNSVADTVTITVKAPPNTVPIANAGPDQTAVASGATVTLDGSASSSEDAGQALVSYTWTETSSEGVVLTNPTTASPTFTAPTLLAGTPDRAITFSLIVNDGIDSSIADTVTITVYSPVAPDSYEMDNDSLSAKTIIKNETQAHTIHSIGGEDWLTFTVTDVVTNVVIETSNSNNDIWLRDFDTWLWLYDSTLMELDFDDNSGSDMYSQILVNELQPGTYFIRITDANFDNVIAGYNIRLQYSTGSTENETCAVIKAVNGNYHLLCL
ncbi:MAG: PKD domain-containing protein [Arenicella sp.]